MSSRSQLKQFFQTNDYPTEGQFADLIDSVAMTGDSIDFTKVTGLEDALADKANQQDLDNKADKQDLVNVKNALIVHPIYTAPVLTLSSPQSSNFYEVGEQVNVSLSALFTQKDGGSVVSYQIQKNGSQVAATSQFSETISMMVAATTYQSLATYLQGPIKKNNFNEDDATGRISASSVTSNNVSFQGYYATWYGPTVVVPSNSANVRALSGKLLTAQSNSAILNTGASQTMFAIVTPAAKSLASVVDLDALNLSITSEYVYQGVITVNNAGGVPVAGFKLYLKTSGVAYSSNHRHQFTIQ
jgi:hypothetical protein